MMNLLFRMMKLTLEDTWRIIQPFRHQAALASSQRRGAWNRYFYVR